MQYYVIADDAAGRQFLRALRDAALRGVRVRLLVDDLHSGDVAELLAGLAAHERVEVRLFNPLPLRSGSPMTRLLLSPSQFEQLHRRMHNKLFIADGHVAVTGGRNIGDEYFMHASAANFVDMDILSTGAVLRALRQVFERYWNSAHAYPLQTLQAAATTGRARERFDAQVQRAAAAGRADADATCSATARSAAQLDRRPPGTAVRAACRCWPTRRTRWCRRPRWTTARSARAWAGCARRAPRW